MLTADLSLVRGDTQSVGVNILNPDGSAVNWSGQVVTFTAKCDLFTPCPLIQIGVTGDALAVSGLGYIPFATGDTATLGNGPYYYDIKLVSTGTLTTLAAGNLRLYPQ